MKYYFDEGRALTKDIINKFIELDKPEQARKIKLHNYYKGKHDILKRTFDDASKPNNRVVNPYARYITTLITGYFVGEPIQYTSEDEVVLNVLSDVFDYNDEPSVNKTLAKNQSIFGEAYEALYVDTDGNPRFKALSSEGEIPIYSSDIDEHLIYHIRYWDAYDVEKSETVQFVEVSDAREIVKYRRDLNGLAEISRVPHMFEQVPVNVYFNNDEAQGDFELVISEIDAYDAFESDSVNEADYFADSYLMLMGMQGTDEETIANMRHNRALLMPEGSSAGWLTKNVNDSWIENEKKRLDADIHKFSFCPAMTDDAFAQNASGVAMRYKLMGLENAVSVKESEFEKGLRRRIELLYNIIKKSVGDMDYLDVNIIFTRNIPQDLASAVEVVNSLDGVISDETRLSLLPIDIDANAELEAVEEKKLANYSLFADNFTGVDDVEDDN